MDSEEDKGEEEMEVRRKWFMLFVGLVLATSVFTTTSFAEDVLDQMSGLNCLYEDEDHPYVPAEILDETVLDGGLKYKLLVNGEEVSGIKVLEPNQAFQITIDFAFKKDVSIKDHLEWYAELPEFFETLGIQSQEKTQIKDESGNLKATYWIDNGFVSLKFDRNWIQANSSLVSGSLAFDGEFKNDSTQEEKQIEVTLPENAKLDLVVQPKPVDVSNTKKMLEKFEDGIAYYKYRFTASEPSSRFILNDVLGEYLELIDTSLVFDGNEVSDVRKMNHGFSYAPGLVQAGEHVLTYQAKVVDFLDVSNDNGDFYLNGTSNTMTLHGASKVEESTTNDLQLKRMEKSGIKNEDGSVTWTIVLNKIQNTCCEVEQPRIAIDLRDMRLEDQMRTGTIVEDSLSCEIHTDEGQFEKEISLHKENDLYFLEFDDSFGSNEVVITYKTAGYERNDLVAHNHAKLKRNGKLFGSVGSEVKLAKAEATLTKTYVRDKETGITNWTVRAHVPFKVNSFNLRDQLSVSASGEIRQHTTYNYQDVDEIKVRILKDGEVIEAPLTDRNKTYIECEYLEGLENFDIELVYKTFDNKQVAKYRNDVTLELFNDASPSPLEQHVEFEVTQDKPLFNKQFDSSASKLEGPLNKREYVWSIEANKLLGSYEGFVDLTGKTITIYEHIPDGMKFKELRNAYDHHVRSVTEVGNEVIITLEGYKKDLISFDVVCTLDESFVVQTDSEMYVSGGTLIALPKVTNRADLQIGDYRDSTESSRKVEIPVLDKNGRLDEKSSNVKYTIEVNKDEALLIGEESKKLTIKDTLDERTSYLNGSLVVTNKEGKNITALCELKVRQDGLKQVLEIKVPNRTHCKIAYETTLKGTLNEEIDVVTNVVEVSGYKTSCASQNENLVVKKALADVRGVSDCITIRKFRGGNTNVVIPGTEFKLSKLDVLTGNATETVKKETDNKGIVEFKNLELYQLYKLEESKAAPGYRAYTDAKYIVLTENANKDYTDIVEKIREQAWFDGNYIESGNVFDYFNVREFEPAERKEDPPHETHTPPVFVVEPPEKPEVVPPEELKETEKETPEVPKVPEVEKPKEDKPEKPEVIENPKEEDQEPPTPPTVEEETKEPEKPEGNEPEKPTEPDGEKPNTPKEETSEVPKVPEVENPKDKEQEPPTPPIVEEEPKEPEKPEDKKPDEPKVPETPKVDEPEKPTVEEPKVPEVPKKDEPKQPDTPGVEEPKVPETPKVDEPEKPNVEEPKVSKQDEPKKPVVEKPVVVYENVNTCENYLPSTGDEMVVYWLLFVVSMGVLIGFKEEF